MVYPQPVHAGRCTSCRSSHEFSRDGGGATFRDALYALYLRYGSRRRREISGRLFADERAAKIEDVETLPVRPSAAPVRPAADREILAHCLGALRCYDPAPVEILVVDDGSPEPISGWIGEESGPSVRVVHQANAGPASTRNTGVTGSDAGPDDIVVFVDADVVVPLDTFARLAADFARWPSALAVWGAVTADHPHRDVISRYKNLTHRHFTLQRPDETRHLTTMLAAVRRSAFDQTGGFDEAYSSVSVEDVELGRTLHDAGLSVFLDRALAAEHRHRFTAMSALRNDFRKARAMATATLDRRACGSPSVQTDGPGERRQVRYLLSGPLGVAAVGAALTGRWRWSAAFLAALAYVERDLVRFIADEEGPLFTAALVPWMAVERTTVAVAVVAGTGDHLVGRVRRRVRG